MRLTFLDVATLCSFPVLLSIGQLLFKKTAGLAAGASLVAAIPVYIRDPLFYAALTLYGVATLLWLWILSRYSLAVAYPFAALALVFVSFGEILFFGGRTPAGFWLGLALVIVGLALIARANVA